MGKIAGFSIVLSAFLVTGSAFAHHDANQINFAALDSICERADQPLNGDECFDRQFDAADNLMSLLGHLPFRRKKALEGCMAASKHLDFVNVITCYNKQISTF